MIVACKAGVVGGGGGGGGGWGGWGSGQTSAELNSGLRQVKRRDQACGSQAKRRRRGEKQREELQSTSFQYSARRS